MEQYLKKQYLWLMPILLRLGGGCGAPVGGDNDVVIVDGAYDTVNRVHVFEANYSTIVGGANDTALILYWFCCS